MAGDLAVDLLDLSEFASIFFGGEYDASVDFVWDGAINLTDVGKMGVGFGVQCPAPA